MNRWLSLAMEPANGREALPDTRTEPDKTPFCPVLSGCRVEELPPENRGGAALAATATAPVTPAASPGRVADAAPPTGGARPPDDFRHGVSVTGRPLTWTGKVVSLEDWRRLTAWERHGPDGRVWNGLTAQWEAPEGDRQ